MPGIKVPDYINCPIFPIIKFGVVAGNKEKTSSAIEQTIYQANKAGVN